MKIIKIFSEVNSGEKLYSVILNEKEFSFTSKLKAGLKAGEYGFIAGGILTPGNIILALCGKKKASLIMTAIGAGVGAGIGFYHGWKNESWNEKYKDKIKNDPKFREEESKKLQEHIKNSLQHRPILISKEDFKNNIKINYKPDVYHYIDLYNKFTKKYYKEWVKAWENLEMEMEIDEEFNIVFPEPYIDEEPGRDDYIVANGEAPSDHYWILWDEIKGNYNNDLGSGKGNGKTLLEASQNFASQWIVDERKIEKPNIRKVAEIHNRIIKEFLKLK